MKLYGRIIEEVLDNDGSELEEGVEQMAYSLYLREIARLKGAKDYADQMECLARMIALSRNNFV